MNSTNTFFEVLTDSEILQLKRKLRAMENKRDKIAIKLAKNSNLPNMWTIDMINWNIPENHAIRKEFTDLECEINDLKWVIGEAEAINSGNYDYFKAKQKVYETLGKLTIYEELEFLKQIGLTKDALISKVAENPDFLEEVMV